MTAETLTLTDIIRALGRDGEHEKKTRSMLARFLSSAETRTLLGAISPTRPTFPAAALPVFAALLTASDAGHVTPKMGATWLAKHFPAVPIEIGNPKSTEIGNAGNGEDAIIGLSDLGFQIPLGFQTVMTQFVQAVCEMTERIPVPDDRLLGREEAACLLHCSPNVVRKRLPPVRRGVWRYSDVMRYIASLG